MKKIAFITGGNKGIGLEVTRFFLKENYRVVVLARDFKNFEFNSHDDVQTISYDLSNTEGIPEIIAGFDRIDVLINNAGVLLTCPYDEYSPEKMVMSIKINLEAPIILMTEVGKKMVEQKSGRIVNNSSIAAHIGHPDVWYGATKAGLLNATKSFSKILGPSGIIVNAVAPSPVETDMLLSIPKERREAIKKTVVSGRFAKATEVSDTITWLATVSPEYINGVCIDINNGAYPR
ncbi:MAG: SDR family oxidoreductase [Desulfotalea sp.]